MSEQDPPALGYLVTHLNDVVYELEDDETQIGRADSNDIVRVSQLCPVLFRSVEPL